MRRGGAFYDLPGVLERYREARPPGLSDPNRVMEEPALLEPLAPSRACGSWTWAAGTRRSAAAC